MRKIYAVADTIVLYQLSQEATTWNTEVMVGDGGDTMFANYADYNIFLGDNKNHNSKIRELNYIQNVQSTCFDFFQTNISTNSDYAVFILPFSLCCNNYIQTDQYSETFYDKHIFKLVLC